MGVEVPESATAENPEPAEEPSTVQKLRGRAQTWASDGLRVLGTRANMKGVVRAAREPRKPKRRLANISEQRVLKQGIRRLNSLLLREGVDLLDLPRRPDGTPRLLRPKFFERLLSNEVTLQTSMPNDIAAAQSDLKHLRLEQLLAIRMSALDFATASQSHDAHNNFLNTLDKSLFEYTARQHFRDSSTILPSAPDPLYRLGLRMCLVLGVASIMQDGILETNGNGVHTEAEERASPSSPPQSPGAVALPEHWALPVETGQWPDDIAAVLFDIAFLGVEPVRTDTVVAKRSRESIAVICDRTSGVGKAGPADVSGAESSEATSVNAEWRKSVEELERIDGVITELREEIQQFEHRREVIARREATLRQRLTDLGRAPPVEKAEASPSKIAVAESSTTASESSVTGPMLFELDGGGRMNSGSRPSSLEDWEQGLELIEKAGSTKDRAAALRMHWMMSSNREK